MLVLSLSYMFKSLKSLKKKSPNAPAGPQTNSITFSEDGIQALAFLKLPRGLEGAGRPESGCSLESGGSQRGAPRASAPAGNLYSSWTRWFRDQGEGRWPVLGQALLTFLVHALACCRRAKGCEQSLC